MPKFMTYQRPAPVSKANWAAPVRRMPESKLPKPAVREQDSQAPLPASLDKLLQSQSQR